MEFDLGGVASLIATIAFLVVVFCLKGKLSREDMHFKNIVQRCRNAIQDCQESIGNLGTLRTMIVILLWGIMFLSIWLAVRASALFLFTLTLEEGFGYSQYMILDMISYALIANLSYNIFKTIKEKTDDENEDVKESIRPLVKVALQAALTGIIVFLPKYGDRKFVSTIGDLVQGIYGFFIILGAMVLVFIMLIISWNQMTRQVSK